jgi:hypothetical protein
MARGFKLDKSFLHFRAAEQYAAAAEAVGQEAAPMAPMEQLSPLFVEESASDEPQVVDLEPVEHAAQQKRQPKPSKGSVGAASAPSAPVAAASS